jgi:hypothetical protein
MTSRASRSRGSKTRRSDRDRGARHRGNDRVRAEALLVWKVDTAQRFGVEKGFFGAVASPLVAGDQNEGELVAVRPPRRSERV